MLKVDFNNIILEISFLINKELYEEKKISYKTFQITEEKLLQLRK